MKKFSNLAENESVAGFVFLAPNFLGFLVFTSLPVLASLVLSFFHWDLLSAGWPEYIGIENFVALLGFGRKSGGIVANDPRFWQYLYNTVFLMAAIPISMAGSLVAALALNQKLRGVVFFRTVFFLPTVCSGVAVLLLWQWVFDSQVGILNYGLQSAFDLLHLGIQPPQWLGSTTWVKPALMIMGFWGSVGGMNMILYLAALTGVPVELYEAAEIDGASPWQKFRAVTMPFISPTTFFILVMALIYGFQSGFMQAYVMTQGGPAGASTTIEYYIFNQAYQYFNMGYAASIAWFLFVVVFIVTLINWRFGGRLVHY